MPHGRMGSADTAPDRAMAKRILIAEDEPSIVISLEFLLKEAGYDVTVARDGSQALTLTGELRPDLVVLDVMLPGFDGLEVMRRLHADLDARVPVILLTAKGEEADRLVGLRSGADDYVVKPFSPAELVARIDAVLRRTRGEDSAAEPLRFGDLEIDPSGRAVAVGGREVELTHREFELLHFLATNPGQVFSRDQLMDRVWQFPFYNDVTTVTVHIRRLRAKVEPDPASPRWIQTVWGVGYRFRPDAP